MFVNTLEFFKVFGKQAKRNKKREICYNNFALWNVETIVDAKRQKQRPQSALEILIETFCKLKFFKVFHWQLITTDLVILRDFSFDSPISTSPY